MMNRGEGQYSLSDVMYDRHNSTASTSNDKYVKVYAKVRLVVLAYVMYTLLYTRQLLYTLEFRLDGTKINGENNT